MSPSPGHLDRYEILIPIASGGMATVYLARSRGVGGFEREVAVKKLHPHLLNDAPDAALDLIEEAKLASRIRHPNVVPVLDVGDGPDGVFLVMEYIEGETLTAILRDAAAAGATLPIPIALRILSDVLAGLHAAHELRDETGAPAGLVHRDFSPQNILVGTDGVARLTDFGIAKAANRLSSTQTGSVKGKVSYMAPEQARGRQLDRRCDVWAAGVVAWEVFAGRRLFSPKLDPVAVVMSIVTEPPPRLRSVRPDLPAELEEAVAWALQADGARRCPSAEDLRQRLLGAWGRAAMPADPSEVAAHVARVAGPKLSERRRRVENLQSAAAPDARSTPPPALAAATPAMPALPRPAEPALPRPAEHTAPMATTEMAEHTTQTVTAETATDLSVTLRRAPTAGASTFGGDQPPTSLLPDPPQLASPGRRGRTTAIAAGIAVVAVAAFWAASSLRAGDAGSEPRAASPDEAAPVEPAPALQAAALTAQATTPETAATPEAPARSSLSIQADAPITQLRLGERVIAVASPSKSVTVELLPDERGESLSVQVIAADGRRALAENVSGATAVVTFDRPRKAAAPPRKRPTGTSSKPGLMPSPYEKR